MGLTRAQIKAAVLAVINDNSSGDITPADVRSAFDNLIDNLFNLEDDAPTAHNPLTDITFDRPREIGTSDAPDNSATYNVDGTDAIPLTGCMIWSNAANLPTFTGIAPADLNDLTNDGFVGGQLNRLLLMPNTGGTYDLFCEGPEKLLEFIEVPGTTYSISAGDAGAILKFINVAGCTVTVDTGIEMRGKDVELWQAAAGTVIVQPGAGMNLYGKLNTAEQDAKIIIQWESDTEATLTGGV